MRKLIATLALVATTVLVVACGDRASDRKTEAPPERPAATAERPARRAPQPTDPVVFQTLQGFEQRTETQRMNCVIAGATADGLTVAEAGNVAVGHEGTIDGRKVTFQSGDTYYSLCGGPSAEERLAIVSNERADISEWIYQDPEAARVRSNTWAYRAQLVESRLGERGDQVTALQSRLSSAITADWIQNILILVLVLVALAAFFRDSIFGSMKPVREHEKKPAGEQDTTAQPAR